MIMEKKNEILELSSEIALHIIESCELLEDNRMYVISRNCFNQELI